MLNEIDVDKISDVERLKDFTFLCDAALKFLDDEFALDEESRALVNLSDDLFEAKLANRTTLSKKLASARRYRNRRQHILNKKKQADDNRVSKVVAKKMALSLKTRTGREKRKYHTESIEWHGDFGEFMKVYHHSPKAVVPETRQKFEIDGKTYSVPSSIIKKIEEGLVYVIRTGAEHYIQFTDDARIEVRDLVKGWK